MLANLAERKVRRGDREADFGSNKPAWQALVKLARNYPSRTSAKALWEDGTTELGSVYTAICSAPLELDHLKTVFMVQPFPSTAA
jgi:hypothetical protein